MEIVLYQTDIAQNFGTIARTCVAFDVPLNIVEPLGFVWDSPKMRRAGMDYLERAKITRHKNWNNFLATKKVGYRLVLLTTKGATSLQNFIPQPNDYYIFGRESAGVPDDVHSIADERIVIPLIAGERSINIAQSCAITIFDVLQKLDKLPNL